MSHLNFYDTKHWSCSKRGVYKLFLQPPQHSIIFGQYHYMSLTAIKLPDIPRFCRQVIALNSNINCQYCGTETVTDAVQQLAWSKQPSVNQCKPLTGHIINSLASHNSLQIVTEVNCHQVTEVNCHQVVGRGFNINFPIWKNMHTQTQCRHLLLKSAKIINATRWFSYINAICHMYMATYSFIYFSCKL